MNEKIPVVNHVAELDEEQDQVAECKTNLDIKDKETDAEEYNHKEVYIKDKWKYYFCLLI